MGIRAAQPEDIGWMTVLGRDAHAEATGRFIDGWDDVAAARTFLFALDPVNPHTAAFVDEDEGGFIVASLASTFYAPTSKIAQCVFFAVAKDRRGVGLGRALRNEAEKWARSVGAGYLLTTRREEEAGADASGFSVAEHVSVKRL
jgi:GNAT superfamily N-acetyltransferase